jgi:uncharacterized protein YecT (DUF1311 family)
MGWILVMTVLLAGSGATQLEQNNAACAKTEVERKKLEGGLKELLRRAQKDAGLSSRIMKAQQAWVTFKDAQLAALFGSSNPLADYGSVWPMCSCVAEEELLRERLAQVQRMLTRVEGDVCGWTRP